MTRITLSPSVAIENGPKGYKLVLTEGRRVEVLWPFEVPADVTESELRAVAAHILAERGGCVGAFEDAAAVSEWCDRNGWSALASDVAALANG